MLQAMLDTNVVSALMRSPGGSLWQRVGDLGRGGACMSAVSAAELRFGIERSGSVRNLRQFETVLEAIAVLPLSVPVDVAYARIRAELESASKPIGPNDLIIAAHALSLDLILATANVREFARVPDLRAENWLD